MEIMKALTIWQPWASLWACGAKGFETRSWATSYRGPIAIHAAALKIPQMIKKCFPLSEWTYHPDYEAKMKFLDAVAKGFGGVYTTEEILEKLNSLPTGAVIATAILKGCHEIGQLPKYEAEKELEGVPHETGCWDCNQRGKWIAVPDLETMFGNWTPGRYAWEVEDIELLPEPIPVKGRQGLWDWRTT